MQRTEWFKRSFPAIEDNGLLPTIIERLAGTPARAEEIVEKTEPALLVFRPEEKWTIKEEIGHLSDMEPLWLGRLEDLVNGIPELRVADLTNQTTHKAGHNGTDTKRLLQKFREERYRLVEKLNRLEEACLNNTSLHPRLKTPMRIIDLAYFVAEHDDHHLSGIRQIINRR